MFNSEYALVVQTVSGSRIESKLKAETSTQLEKMRILFYELAKRYAEDKRTTNPMNEDLQETIQSAVKAQMKQVTEEIIKAVKPTIRTVIREEVNNLPKSNPERITDAVRGMIRQEVPKIAARQAAGTYADQLRIPQLSVPNMQSEPRPAGNVVAVRQSIPDRDKSPERVQEDFKKAIDPRKENLHLKAVRPGKGGIVVVAETKEEIEKIRNSAALREAGLVVEDVKSRDPLLLMRNIDTDLTAEKVQEGLFAQNSTLNDGGKMSLEQFKKNFRPVRKLAPKEPGSKGQSKWIVECSPQVRNLVRKADRLYLDYGTVRCEDYIVPSRCFNCQAYKHVAKHCTAKDPTCGYCAKEGHKYADCPDKKEGKIPHCAPCTRMGEKEVNHATDYKECKAWLKAREALVRDTDYGL